MTRKQERRQRTGRWAAMMAAGTGASLAVAALGPGWLATLPLLLALLAGHRIMIGPPGVPVLTYHSVAADPRWLPWANEISVHPHTFQRHLATLAKMGCSVIGTRDFVARTAAGENPPRDAVVLHFDDGYLDNWLNAVPLLDRFDMPATFFVSLDFIEPGSRARTTADDPDGYMNWTEITTIEAHPRFEIEPHGVAHARVPVSDRVVDRLTADNWRHHAWLQWAAMPGPKHDWFRAEQPVAVPLGSPVPQSGLALAERAWLGDAREDHAALETRIYRDLDACQATFAERLGRVPQIFCWPENIVGAEGRGIAARLGYRATTGGRGRNVAGEDPSVISRLHMGDRALGFRWLAAEALHLRAVVRLAQGNHYWYFVVAPMNLARKIIMAMRAGSKR